jgi:hypothetical protein
LMRYFIIAILAAAILLPASAFAQERGPSQEDFINASYSGPVFQDAFWTDRTTMPAEGTSLEKIEVGPGDGTSVLAVTLVNRGLADITSVSGSLAVPAGFKATGGGAQATAKHNQIVQEGEAFTLFFQVDVLADARVQGYNGVLTIQYSRVNEVGQPRSDTINVPFRLTGKSILDAQGPASDLSPGANEVSILLVNKGTAPATSVTVTISMAGDNSSAGAVNIGAKTFEAGTIPPNGSFELNPVIYVSNAAGDTLQSAILHVTYGDAYGVRKTTDIAVGIIVLPRALDSDLSVAPSDGNIVTAGKIYNYNFTVSNVGDEPLNDMLLTLSSETETIEILGDSKWTIKAIEPGTEQELATRVFAPTDLIGTPTTFNLSVKYVSSGQPKTESIDLGAYVEGEISVRAYEIGVNYIGGTPNIVGNLLNEGNTLALFTTIEVASADGLASSLPPEQYLGDLTENSPLPFSIPIDVGDAQAGTYPVKLKVTYKDDLRQLHTFEVDSNVDFQPEQPADEASQGSGAGSGMMIGVIAAIAVAVIIAVIVIKRRKKSALRRTIGERKQDDIESLLDSHIERKPEDRK